MNSLKEVFGAMQDRDHVKVAEARQAMGLPPDINQAPPELLKQAQDYDYIGRVLAHNVMGDLIKQALDETNLTDEEKAKALAATLAAANGDKPAEKTDEEKKKDEDDAKAKEEAKDDETAAKTAAAKKRILGRMAKDPKYVSALVAKHQKG